MSNTVPLTEADMALFGKTFGEVETLVTGEPHPEWVEDARYYGLRLLAAYRRVTAERDGLRDRIAALESAASPFPSGTPSDALPLAGGPFATVPDDSGPRDYDTREEMEAVPCVYFGKPRHGGKHSIVEVIHAQAGWKAGIKWYCEGCGAWVPRAKEGEAK